MIKEAIKSIKEIFIPKTELIEDNIQCAVDDDVVDCADFKQPYLGVPAPAYLTDDPWFPAPVLSEKQVSVKEAHEQAIADQQILDESKDNESADIHQKLYEIASKNWTTVGETQVSSQGGSENFHEGPSGPGGWMSGTGYRQFK